MCYNPAKNKERMIGMEEKKLTRRQQITIQMLREAYVDLLKEFDAKDVTIVRLCEAADVNRTTFYRYYVDLDEFVSAMSTELFYQIFSVLDIAEAKGVNSRRKILQALNITIRNKKLFQHLLRDSHSGFVEKAMEEKLTLIKNSVMGTGCTEGEGEICYSYLCGGLAGIWAKWVAQNCSTPKEKVAQIIEQFINSYYETLGNGFILEKP